MKESHTSVKAMFLIIPDVTDNTENQGPLGARGQCSMVHTAPRVEYGMQSSWSVPQFQVAGLM